MRLIDADEVKETIRHRTKLVEWQKGIIWALIDMHKTIDAVPVIRCKDCKYYTGKWCTKYSTKQFDINDICKADDDFCSRAERKEE